MARTSAWQRVQFGYGAAVKLYSPKSPKAEINAVITPLIDTG
jgi:hypothetical protein